MTKEDVIEKIDDLWELAESDDGTFSGWELDFITNLKERYDSYGDSIWLTDRQLEAAENILEKAGI